LIQISYEPAGPTVDLFHQSDAFIRGLLGPVGSAKTSACVTEIVSRAIEQEPFRGVRKTRWVALRNTYAELKSTTIKSFCEWFPNAKMRWDSPIVGRVNFYLPDKTKVECEVFFLAVERPEDVDKLKGMELTGGWMNESGEMAKAIFDMMVQRLGRYPPKRWGGPSWTGAIMDTNPPDDDNWYYKLAEEQDPSEVKKMEAMLLEYEALKPGQKLMEFFHQPGGLMEKDGQFIPNPQAENIQNLPGGYAYYLKQLAGKKKEWIKVFLCGQYGTVSTGKPVYPEYNDDLHCKEFELYPKQPLILGFDYGLTPACIIGQLSPRGALRILDELVAKDMGIRSFANDVVKPHLAMNYPGYEIRACGDPAGLQRAQTEESTCFMELANAGIPAMPAITNDFLARREAVAGFLGKIIDGEPAFRLHPRCRVLRRGFNGSYCYERIQVSGERYRDRPVKNDYSHPHDGLQYLALHTQQINTNADFGKKIVYPERTGIV